MKKDAKYQKQVTLGFDEDGKRIRKRFYANSQSDLTRQIAEAMANFEKEHCSGTITLKRYIDLWLAANMVNRDFSTEEYYATAFRKLEPLYSKELKDITKTDLQKIIADNWDMPRTCKKIKQTASKLLRNAIDDKFISTNPAANLTLPKYKSQKKRQHIRLLTEAEEQAVKSVKLPPAEHLFLMLEYYFGCRPQELRALTPAAFDLKKKELKIDKAVAFRNGNPYVKSTKNWEIRTLPIPEILIPEISAYFAQMRSVYLFTMKNKELMTKSSFTKFSNRILKAVKDEMLKKNPIQVYQKMTLYTFRHNVGTMLYYKCLSPDPNARLSPKKAAYYMGNSEEVFLANYAHIDESKETLKNVFEKSQVV